MHFCRPIPPTLLFHLEHEEGKLGTRSHPFCFESEVPRLKILSDNLKTFNNENFTKNVPALVKSAFEGPVKPVHPLSFAQARKNVLSHCCNKLLNSHVCAHSKYVWKTRN